MYEIYLTESRDGQTFRVADLTTVQGLEDAQTICVKAQPWLRDGIEAHFDAESDPRHGVPADSLAGRLISALGRRA